MATAEEVARLARDSQELTAAANSDQAKGRYMPVPLGEGTEIRGRYRYRLGQQLGRGGFGSVYLAQTLEADNGEPDAPPPEVAVKFYHMPAATDQLSLLKRELSALLALQHTNVIRVYDWGFERSPFFMVLEYHPSGSLLDHGCYDGKPLDTAGLLKLLQDLLSSLNAAHQASILHLDMKPGNVLCRGNGDYVLTDFGISQGLLVSHHVVDTGIGSPGYQSPEQRECNRRWIGPRTDLWGVGATAWSAYTGMRLDIHQQLLRDPKGEDSHGLPPVSEFRECPSELEEFLMSLLWINPAGRPGGAAEALANLQQLTAACDPNSSSRALGRANICFTGQPEVSQVIDNLVDPLWVSICSAPRPVLKYVWFKDGDVLCGQGESAYLTYVLLSGRVEVTRNGQVLARESREGTFLGENATLTGRPRTATIRADGPVCAIMFNAAELEQFVISNPAVGIRLIKTLAMRNRMNDVTNYGP